MVTERNEREAEDRGDRGNTDEKKKKAGKGEKEIKAERADVMIVNFSVIADTDGVPREVCRDEVP